MKIALKYGFITALVIAVVNSFFVDLLGIEYDFVRRFSGFFPFIILAVGLFLAMRESKRVEYNNELNFGQAIYSGIVITAFIALCSATYNFVYFQFLNPDYAEGVIKYALPLMQSDKLKPEEINEYLLKIRDTYKPINQLTATFIVLMVWGILFSAVFSAILRTKDTFTQIVKDRNKE